MAEPNVRGVSADAELGFRRPRRSRSTVAGVDRQQFIRAALGVGAAIGAGPVALIMPAQPTPVPSVVGWAEVAEVRNVAQAFGGLTHRIGSAVVV